MEEIPLLICGDSPSGISGLGRMTYQLAMQIGKHMSDVFDVGTLGAGQPPDPALPFKQYPMGEVKDWIPQNLPYAWMAHSKGREGIMLWAWDISRLLWLAYPDQCENADVKSFLQTFPFKKWVYPAIDAAGPNGHMPVLLADALAQFDRVVNYTQFSAKITGYPGVCCHGIDTSIFYRRGDARDILRKFDVEAPEDGELLIGIVATNQPRKDWAMAFGALALLGQAGYRVRLWLHTDVVYRYWDLKSLYVDFGLQPNVKVFLTQYGISEDDLAHLYSACDLTLGIGPEGFGRPLAESLCCGTPVIAGSYGGQTDFMPKEFLVDPIAYRYETVFAVQRPVYNSQHFADKIVEVLKNPAMRALAKPTPSYDDVWPAWEAWLRAGISRDKLMDLQRIKELNYDHHRRMTEDHNRIKAEEALHPETANTRENLDDAAYRVMLAGIPKVEMCLELGSASGGQWHVLGEWATGLTGIDLFEPAVLNSQKEGKNIHLGFIEEMPFPDDSFDLVCSRHVMEHVADIQVALAGIKRVLRPGGFVAAATPHYFPDVEPAHIQQLRLEEWVKEYEKAGFTIVSANLYQCFNPEAHIVARK